MSPEWFRFLLLPWSLWMRWKHCLFLHFNQEMILVEISCDSLRPSDFPLGNICPSKWIASSSGSLRRLSVHELGRTLTTHNLPPAILKFRILVHFLSAIIGLYVYVHVSEYMYISKNLITFPSHLALLLWWLPYVFKIIL